MREALGGLSLVQIVILFLLLFVGIMCLTINESKAYAVKDEIITIIENAPLMDDYSFSEETTQSIAAKFQEVGYRTTGTCPSSSWTAYDRDGKKLSNPNNATFCVKANKVANIYTENSKDVCNEVDCNIADGKDYPKMVYYDIVLFYELDIPIISHFMRFKVYSSTKVLVG